MGIKVFWATNPNEEIEQVIRDFRGQSIQANLIKEPKLEIHAIYINAEIFKW